MIKGLHVLIIAQYFYPDFGGASTRAYNCAISLKKQGCNVTVLTSFPHYPQGDIPAQYKGKFYSKEKINEISVIRTWIPSLAHSTVKNRVILHLSFIFSSLSAMRLVKKPDIIIAMNPNLFSFYSAIVYSTFFHSKIIRNIDDLWPEIFYDLGIVKFGLAKRILDALSRFSYQRSRHLIPVSAGYIQTLVEKYGIPREKITVIEHGVDIDRFHKIPPLENKTKEKKVILYSGALNEGYDFKIVIEAAKLLQSNPIHFIIRGNGNQYSSILRMVEENSLSNIEVNNKLLSPEELVSLMRRADLFLLPMNSPSIMDNGLPTKILEYQALAKPIICVSEGEPARYIRHSKSGIVVKPRDPDDLAEAITRLTNDPELCENLGLNGYANITENLTFDRIGKRFLDVFSKIQ